LIVASQARCMVLRIKLQNAAQTYILIISVYKTGYSS